jgi:hypothetical protein
LAGTTGIDLLGSVAICAVDNNPCRVAASKFYASKAIPVIFTVVSREADGYVFIQEPGKACFGCLFPKAINDDTYPVLADPPLRTSSKS